MKSLIATLMVAVCAVQLSGCAPFAVGAATGAVGGTVAYGAVSRTEFEVEMPSHLTAKEKQLVQDCAKEVNEKQDGVTVVLVDKGQAKSWKRIMNVGATLSNKQVVAASMMDHCIMRKKYEAYNRK